MPSVNSEPWAVLGLEGPTDDLKIIKKAYAAKLKTTRPEDDPEGFMVLRRAFDSVTRKDTPVYAEPVYGTPQTTDVATDTADKMSDFDEPVSQDLRSHLPEYYHEIRQGIYRILENPERRSNIRIWEQYFKDEFFENMDHDLALPHIMLECLMDFTGVFDGLTLKESRKKARTEIGKDAGVFIFEQMGWSDLIERSYDDNSNWDVRWLAQVFGIGLETRDKQKVRRGMYKDIGFFLICLTGFVFWARGFISDYDSNHLFSYGVGASIAITGIMAGYLFWEIVRRSGNKVSDMSEH